MANLKINNGGNQGVQQPKIKIGGQKVENKVSQQTQDFKPVTQPAPEIESEDDIFSNLPMNQPNQQDFGIPKPTEPINIPHSDSVISSNYEDEDDEEVDESTLSPKELRQKQKLDKKKKTKKSKGSKTTKSNKKNKDDKKPQTPEEAYSAYKRRKVLVIVLFALIVLGLLTFGTYNTFFKHTLTANEAATATNRYNNQTQAQQWDTGVEGYLQANLYSLLSKDMTIDSQKDFTVSNIAIEKNEQLSNNIILTFFSADITCNGVTDRVFMTLPLSIEDNTFKLAGRINMTTRQRYSSDTEEIKENPFLDFNGDVLSDESKELETTLDNFLNTGYNAKKDVSDFYNDDFKLEFNGTYDGIVSCNVYDEPNALGYNAFATYDVTLPSGITYTNCIYMEVEKNSSGKYNIVRLL